MILQRIGLYILTKYIINYRYMYILILDNNNSIHIIYMLMLNYSLLQ